MMEIVKPGLETSIQDYPGRIGYWNQGFPPSGPMSMPSISRPSQKPGPRVPMLLNSLLILKPIDFHRARCTPLRALHNFF